MSPAPGLTHLTVYLSRRCNLACRYCYSGSVGGETVKERALLAALKAFVGRAGAGKKITFLGGEPLAAGPLLKKAVLAARAAGPEIPIRVFTNGTLLTPGWLAFFARLGVRLTLSLDGDRRTNDSRRRFRAGRRSVFNAALRALPRKDRAGVTAHMVISPSSAGALARGVKNLCALGFESIAWAPDTTALWGQAALAELKRAMLEVKLHYFKRLKAGLPPYEIANIYEILEALDGRAAAGGCSNLTLGPDGLFYPCDKLIGAPAALRLPYALQPFGIKAGLAGRARFFKEAAAAGAVPEPAMCPVGPWALRGKAGQARAFLSSQAGLRLAVKAGLCALAAEGLKYSAFRTTHNQTAETAKKLK